MDIQLPTSLKPKHLSFDEMWKLYKTIKDALPEKDEQYLLHEIQKTMEKMTNSSFKDTLLSLYGEGYQHNKVPAEFMVMFIRGLKQNKFFAFSTFIRSLSK